MKSVSVIVTWWTFRIFFFSARGGGRGSSRRQEGGGVGFLLKIPRGGGGFQEGEGPGGYLRRIGDFGGGGGLIFFSQKYASHPRPPHTRQKYEQTFWTNMTPNASKQGKSGSLGVIFLFIFLSCMWGLGFQKESPFSGPRRPPRL